MCPIYAIYAPYMAHILSARARPALVDVGPPALTHKRELNYFHTRARRQMSFFSSLVSIIFHNCGSFFCTKNVKISGEFMQFLNPRCSLALKKAGPIVSIDANHAMHKNG